MTCEYFSVGAAPAATSATSADTAVAAIITFLGQHHSHTPPLTRPYTRAYQAKYGEASRPSGVDMKAVDCAVIAPLRFNTAGTSRASYACFGLATILTMR